jgi:glucose-6-phosphate isomerase
MALELRLDHMFVYPHGLDRERLEAFGRDRLPALIETVQEQRGSGRLGFLELPDGGTVNDEIRSFADGAGQAFENVVVLGIGGSALGTIALRTALLGPWWNEMSSEERDYFPRLHVLDNIDPDTVGPFLQRLDLGRTLFNVVSKSGSTAETAAQFLVVQAALEAELGDGWRRHLVFTTDPDRGPLRAIAEAEGIVALPIPPNVGGRFSVLTPVGLLPAALVGIDIEALLAGAREMRERCLDPDFGRNPAARLAAALHLADVERDARVHVLMAYSDRLRDCARWYSQLWAESLGKRADGQDGPAGPTPVAAVGTTDQHSQLQLYAQGPRDKVITFVTVRESQEDLAIPELPVATAWASCCGPRPRRRRKRWPGRVG